LIKAVHFGFLKTCQYLVKECGATIQSTPHVVTAFIQQNWTIANFLLSHYPLGIATSILGFLHIAVEHEQLELLDLLLTNGMNNDSTKCESNIPGLFAISL
jgi:hypothetical protein